MKGTPRGVRWIGGFGDIQWIEAEAFINAAPDILAYQAAAVISHMNEDHRDALRDFVRAHGGVDPAGANLQMISVHSRGFKIRYGAGGGKEIEIPFSRAVQTVDEVRSVMIETLQATRLKLHSAN